MKYQRLSVLTRQLAAVIINTTPGMDEPVEATDIFLTVFDEVKPVAKIEYSPEEWEAEQKRLIEKFKNF